MTLGHALLATGEALEVAPPTSLGMALKRVCGCTIKFRSAVLVRSCGRSHALQTGESVSVVDAGPGGAVLCQAACGCRCFVCDQAVIARCPTA